MGRINMGKSILMLLWLLLTLGSVAAQADKVERALPNWLTGIISVVVFLCVVFIAFLVNKVWCNTSKPEDVFSNEYTMPNGSPSFETSLEAVRSADDPNAFENVIVHQTDEKVTAM